MLPCSDSSFDKSMEILSENVNQRHFTRYCISRCLVSVQFIELKGKVKACTTSHVMINLQLKICGGI